MPHDSATRLGLRLLATLRDEVRSDGHHLDLPVASHAERLPSGARGFSVAFLSAVCDFFAREQQGGDELPMADVCKSQT